MRLKEAEESEKRERGEIVNFQRGNPRKRPMKENIRKNRRRKRVRHIANIMKETLPERDESYRGVLPFRGIGTSLRIFSLMIAKMDNFGLEISWM